jgi:hypothetical protein
VKQLDMTLETDQKVRDEGAHGAVLPSQGINDRANVAAVSVASKPPAQLREVSNTAADKVGVLEELADNKPQAKKLMSQQSADKQGDGCTEARTPERVQQPTTPLLNQQPAIIRSGEADNTRSKRRQECVANPKIQPGTEAESKSNAAPGLDDIRRSAQAAAAATVAAVATAAAPSGASLSSSTADVIASADSTASTAGTAPGKASGTGVFAVR